MEIEIVIATCGLLVFGIALGIVIADWLDGGR